MKTVCDTACYVVMSPDVVLFTYSCSSYFISVDLFVAYIVVVSFTDIKLQFINNTYLRLIHFILILLLLKCENKIRHFFLMFEYS